MENIICCSKYRISYYPVKNKDRSYTHKWKCGMCGKIFEPSLAIEDTVELDEVRAKFDKFIREQKSIPPEYVDIINKNFWDLL